MIASVAVPAIDRNIGRGSRPASAVQQPIQHQPRKSARQQTAHQTGHRSDHQKLNRENLRDALPRRTQRFQDHDFANPPEPGARDTGCQNNRARQNGKSRDESHYERDLIHDRLNGIQHVSHIDNRDGRKLVIDRLLDRRHATGLRADSAIVDGR